MRTYFRKNYFINDDAGDFVLEMSMKFMNQISERCLGNEFYR